MVSRIPPASPAAIMLREEVVEGLRVLAHGVGEARATLDVHPSLLEDSRERLVLLLTAQDLETLDEGQTRVDHDGELPDEDREVLGRNASPELRDGDFLALLLDGRDEDLVAPQEGESGLAALGRLLPGDGLAVACLSLVDERWHGPLLRSHEHRTSDATETHRAPGRAGGRPPVCGVVRPAPRLIMSCSSSGFELAPRAVWRAIWRVR